ncbi:hypothetical protein ACQHIV_38015 [Kribbella sp. GL6]|uniref:hypothetical protein n=1 Tax=Kribbella sp. GL6 TaxID=3419765 RepID=UPI003D009253
MSTFAEELVQRITNTRLALRTAQDEGDIDGERVYAGELDSLLRLAMENDVVVPQPDA